VLTFDNFSDKIWYDILTDNYIEIVIGATFGIANGVKFCVTEIEPVITDYGDLYVAVGINITNSLTSSILIEEFDFVCAVYYSDIYEDFQAPDLLLDASERIMRFPVTVPAKGSTYIILGFEIPYNAEGAIFAYSNIWYDYTGKSYIYFLTAEG